MNKYFWGLIIGLIAIAAIVWGWDNLTQSQADLVYQQARADALIIQAQGQARLDTATAAAVTSSAMLPWLIVFCVSGVVIVCVVFLLRQPATPSPATPARIIERQIVYLPLPTKTTAEPLKLTRGDYEQAIYAETRKTF